MERRGMVAIGFGSFIPAERIVAVVNPDGQPMRRLRQESRESNRLVDATQGKRTRSIIITDSNQVFLSNVTTETLAHRYNQSGLVLTADQGDGR